MSFARFASLPPVTSSCALISPEAELSWGGEPCASQRRSHPTLFDSVPAAKQPTTHHLGSHFRKQYTPDFCSLSHHHHFPLITHMILVHTGTILYEFLACLTCQPRHDRYLHDLKTLTIRAPAVYTVVPPTSQSLPSIFSEHVRTPCNGLRLSCRGSLNYGYLSPRSTMISQQAHLI